MDDAYLTPTHKEASLNARPVKAPFGYYGAKLRLARQIVGTLPPHNAWVEGFCGSAALTLAKDPAPIEVINDLDGEIVNLFEQLRINSKDLCEAISLTPYAREEFQAARTPKSGLDPLEKARRFLVATMMTVNATTGVGCCGFSFSQSYSREGKEARVNRWYNLPERLARVVERLRGVRVENRDARELLGMFRDRPATLIYLDPPYFTKRDHGYVIDAKDRGFHDELLKECTKARCMLLISGYQNELYDEILTHKAGWRKSKIETHTTDTAGRSYARTEVLWMNRNYVKAASLGRVPIRLTKDELRDNKVNPSRKR
ncbi:MAG: DNA adenine methylase [Candidatus Hydrogenedentes bacterium]|nr:DNA adenine methylase [Candidatus Hydrogenedentota bacterium]